MISKKILTYDDLFDSLILSKNHGGISITQHFHLGEINYVIMKYLWGWGNESGEWFYRADFHWGTFRGGFSRDTETGCVRNI